METYQLIKQAIQKKQQVIATYNGFRREMCPHTLGSKNGVAHCLFYQFGGESSSGPIIPGSDKNWRCIAVNQLSDIIVLDGPWHTGTRHSRRQTCIDFVEIEVEI